MAKIKSNFNKDAQGWTIEGDAQSSGWTDTGGNPGGYFKWVDAATGAYAYFDAPEKFLGDLSSYYNGALSYDVIDTAAEVTRKPDVELIGANGMTLVAVVGQAGAAWTHLSVGLGAGAWHVGAIGGAVATEQQIKAVLADVDQLLIRAEYHSGGETGGLDNVLLKSPKHAAIDPAAFTGHAAGGTIADFVPVAHHTSSLDASHMAIA